MIIRILSEGQYDVADAEVDALNELDEKLESAIEANDESAFSAAMTQLLERVRSAGSEVALDVLVPSELVLPAPDASLHEVRDLLGSDGLIPGRTDDSTGPAAAAAGSAGADT